MKELKRKYFVYAIVSIILGLLYNCIVNTMGFNTQNIDIYKQATEGSGSNTEEFIEGSEIEQSFQRPFVYLYSISVQVATYENRDNIGTFKISVFNNGEIIGEQEYDVETIIDGELLNVKLTNYKGKIGDVITIRIWDSTSVSSESVAFFTSENYLMKTMDNNLTFNRVNLEESLNLHMETNSSNLGIMIVIMTMIMFLCIILDGSVEHIVNRYRIEYKFKDKCNNIMLLMILVLIGFIFFTLRNISYITYPIIYAEDATYITNILQKGILQTMFSTRSGNTADFTNVGSYLLLWISLKLSELFFSFNLNYLPIIVGVVSNLFYSVVAVMLYLIFEKKRKILGILFYWLVLLMPVANTGTEVFGRVLNHVFIWPVIVIAVLWHQYESRNIASKQKCWAGMICILAGISFPVSFVPLGVYLGLVGYESVRAKNVGLSVKANGLIIVALVVGLIMLPIMMGSQGGAIGLSLNTKSLIEFIVARHFLYPFVYLFYTYLTDACVLSLFIIYCIIIVYALLCERKKYGVFNAYTFLAISVFAVILSSAIMRITMTTYFYDYETTFPDRYYYACNLLSAILLVYAIDILVRNTKLFYSIVTIITAVYLLNPYLLFEQNLSTLGVGDTSATFADTIENIVVYGADDEITIEVYPTNGFTMTIPKVYYFYSKIDWK